MGQDRLSLFVGNQEMPFAGAGGHSGMIVGLYFPFGKLISEIVNTEVMKKSGPGSCLGIPSELSGNEPGDIRNVQTVHEAGCLKMLLIPLKLFEFGIVQNALYQTAVLGADIIRDCNLHQLSHPFRRERVRIFRGLKSGEPLFLLLLSILHRE